ncbi:hypothetical protein [Microbulbifer sp. PSTR4-B]|uniref:hypothetical protein n=1 Tax=unclassified Microbulbifer TaxID=2619833 RepID=UPI00403AB5C6
MSPTQLFTYGEDLGFRWAKSQQCIRLFHLHSHIYAIAALQPEPIRDGFTFGAQRSLVRRLTLPTSKARTL